MSELATLARPYAAAVFKRAKESAKTAQWSETLAFLSAVVSQPELNNIIGNPKIGRDKLLGLLLDVCQAQIDGEGQNFLKLLVQNGRLGLLPFITKSYEEYKAEDEGYVDVEVVSAYEVTQAEADNLTSTLGKLLGKSVNVHVTLDESLIAGILVRAGDRVFDGTIRGQLQNMHKALL
ncbi:MAG: F0F1 ATP synthase subunit delta [Methylobacter sp.]|nr:MAG: F0F1 ATP synthase subunit delta [Methylobacter sp.]PPD22014.1 MAG: F0F1 ATP synthase subunit delta [Methylobacter sp.]